MYKRAKRVSIESSQGFVLIDVPKRVDGEVIDIDRSILFNSNMKNGTEIIIELEGEEDEMQYCADLVSGYEYTYNNIGTLLYSTNDYKIYLSDREQSFLTVGGIPYSPLNATMISPYQNRLVLDISQKIAGTSQSRTIQTPIVLNAATLAFLYGFTYFPQHNLGHIPSGANVADLPRVNIPWSLMPLNPKNYDDMVESLSLLKNSLPGITEEGIRYLKTETKALLERSKVDLKNIQSDNAKVLKGTSAPKSSNKIATKLLTAIGDAWNELCIKKGVYKTPVETFSVAEITTLGLYDASERKIIIHPDRIRNASRLVAKIKSSKYEEIIEDPDWAFLLSVDSFPAPTLIHEFEHHRDGSTHSSSAHAERENVRISENCVLTGKHTFDMVATQVAKYLFCNGLYNLIRQRLS